MHSRDHIDEEHLHAVFDRSVSSAARSFETSLDRHTRRVCVGIRKSPGTHTVGVAPSALPGTGSWDLPRRLQALLVWTALLVHPTDVSRNSCSLPTALVLAVRIAC